MKISLVSNGIFPICRDKEGKSLSSRPATGFNFPGTIQGEGKLAGIPVLFIRTSGCNLRCVWQTEDGEISICDTPYASHQAEEREEWEIDDIISVLKYNLDNIKHLVISGGEPTMQPFALLALVKAVKTELDLHITLETNGVSYIPQLSEWVDLFSVSPKLQSSEPGRKKNSMMNKAVSQEYIRDHKKTRRNLKTIQQYINACMNLKSYYGDQPDVRTDKKRNKDFQLKFVVSSEQDIEEIKKDYLVHLNFVNQEDILLMPVGANSLQLQKTSEMAARMAIENGWRYAPRLHIDLFNDRRDV